MVSKFNEQDELANKRSKEIILKTERFINTNVYNCNMLVSNTSTLILLAKITVLEKTLETFGEVVIPKKVFEEIVEKRELFDSQLILKQIENKKIIIKEIKTKDITQILSQFRLDEGEAAAYAIYTKGKYKALLTDDKELIKLCRIENIPFITAMAIVIRLNEKNILTKEEALEKLEALYKVGRYSKEIYEFFKQEVK